MIVTITVKLRKPRALEVCLLCSKGKPIRYKREKPQTGCNGNYFYSVTFLPIGHRTINILEIILSVHGFLFFVIKRLSIMLYDEMESFLHYLSILSLF